jgi:hypothetical protein
VVMHPSSSRRRREFHTGPGEGKLRRRNQALLAHVRVLVRAATPAG